MKEKIQALITPYWRKLFATVMTALLFPLGHWMSEKGYIPKEMISEFTTEMITLILGIVTAIWTSNVLQRRENVAAGSDAQTLQELDKKAAISNMPARIPTDVVPEVQGGEPK